MKKVISGKTNNS